MAIGNNLDLSGYKLTFDDEFNQFSSNGGSNLYVPGNAGGMGTWDTTYSYGERSLPGESELYSDPSVGVNPDTVSDGALDIHAAPVTSATENLGETYTSGVITTYHSFSQEYGYFEMRAELPAGAGMWPAFWMLPTVHVWPPELDVLEAFGATNANGEGGATQIHDAVHTTDSSDPSSGGWNGTGGADLYTSYNTFGVQWTPTTLNFFFDGVEYASTPTPADFHQQMFMLANLGIGGSWAGAPAGESGDMKIDYIRAFSDDGSNPAIVQQGVSSPDGGGDSFYGATDADGNGALSVSGGSGQVAQAPVVDVGSGVDTVALQVSEDSFQGDAQFTVSVDGVQVGGVQTATYAHAGGLDQEFLIHGSWGSGSHTVGVDFLNDDYSADPAHYVVIGDRNLYVDGASYDGTKAAADTLALTGNGTQTLTVSGTTPQASPPSMPVILGLTQATDTGASQTDGTTADATPVVTGTAGAGDVVVLADGSAVVGTTTANPDGQWSIAAQSPLAQGMHALTAMSEDAAGQTSAVSIAYDAVIDATAPTVTSLAASASSWPAHAGQTLTFTLAVDGAVTVSGTPTLSLSDGGTALYSAAQSTPTSLVFDATVANGQSSSALEVTALSLAGGSVADIAGNSLTVAEVAGLAGSNTGLSVMGSAPQATLGTGASLLVLDMAEDAYQGDAQFTVSVDGTQVGGVQSASALQGHGTQTFDIRGTWAPGAHSLSVDFLNDLYAGSPTADRNLYVDGASYDGSSVATGNLALMANGSQSFAFQEAAPTLLAQEGDHALKGGTAFSFALPADSFAASNGGALTYSAQAPGGGSLPSWLSFDASSQTFSGTAPLQGGVLAVVAVADTADGAGAAEEFHLYVQPGAPVLQKQAPDQRMAGGTAFSFALPQGSYSDPSGGTVSYRAMSVDGAALPSWISFDASKDAFTGTAPVNASTLGIEVVATSSSGATSAEAFHLYATAPAPVLRTQAPDEFLKGGSAFSFSLPAGSYSAPGTSTLSYAALQTNMTALPSWMAFNAATDTFSGTAPAAAGTPVLGVRIDVLSSNGTSAAEAFHVYLH